MTLKRIFYAPRYLVITVVKVYQRTLSPDHGWLSTRYPQGYCKFHPTCSEYGRQAFERYGVIKGLWLTAWRVLRCNPRSKGGEDFLK